MEKYIVGGSVRDELLGLPIKDRDWVVVGSTPQQMSEQGYRQVGKDFPVFLHPETNEEYALARTERKSGTGYTGFICDTSPCISLEEDLMRRDLTINAIAKKEDGTMIDPYGGQQDIQDRVLRHVSPAFVEDPLRVLRVARFAARFAELGFTLAPETRVLMQTIVRNGEINMLTAERVWVELEKALATSQPQVFFQILRQVGALKILFPELDCLFGVPAPPKWHPEIDTGVHVLLVMQQAAQLTADLRVRFAALVHDLGKGRTPSRQWPSHRGHEYTGLEPLKAVCQRYPVPKEYQQLAQLVMQYHGHCHKVKELRSVTLLKLLTSLDAFRRPQRLELFLLACEADSRGRTHFENKEYPQKIYLHNAFKAAQKVSIQPLLELGLEGLALGEKLYQKRLEALDVFKKETDPN